MSWLRVFFVYELMLNRGLQTSLPITYNYIFSIFKHLPPGAMFWWQFSQGSHLFLFISVDFKSIKIIFAYAV